MRQAQSGVQSTTHSKHGGSTAATNDQHALMRGVVHGVILSMLVWTAALSLTLALR